MYFRNKHIDYTSRVFPFNVYTHTISLCKLYLYAMYFQNETICRLLNKILTPLIPISFRAFSDNHGNRYFSWDRCWMEEHTNLRTHILIYIGCSWAHFLPFYSSLSSQKCLLSAHFLPSVIFCLPFLNIFWERLCL